MLDPQQRMLLEVTWEALERAGIAPSSVAGSQTAVYVGVSTNDYANYLGEAIGLYNGNAYAGSGCAHSMASGRLAYAFDFHGPNAAVDTACSSSHVALHWAVQSLRNGEADMAVSAGVSLILMPIGWMLTAALKHEAPVVRLAALNVLEINSNPAWKGLQTVTATDIAEALAADFLASLGVLAVMA